MILVKDLLKVFEKNNVNFFSGVPDSVLKNLTNELDVNKNFKNYILSNEGSALATGIGYYLQTKKIPAVYMQNSGIGNSLNPLISVAHKKVYQIPLLLIIGWRGAPNTKDEPQHLAQGKITKKILSLCGVKSCIINKKKDLIKLKNLISFSKKEKQPVACLIRNNLLKTNVLKNRNNHRFSRYHISRSMFIKKLLKYIGKKDKIISSTGYLSRDLYYHILKLKLKIYPFYMVGGMGHTSSVSLGYSLKTNNKVICLDGDGSFLMHLGSTVSITKYSKKNLKYILINNKSHESVGGQSTHIEKVNLELFSRSLGYKSFFCLNKKKDIDKILKKFLKYNGSSFLEVKVQPYELENKLPRPKDLLKIKNNFLKK